MSTRRIPLYTYDGDKPVVITLGAARRLAIDARSDLSLVMYCLSVLPTMTDSAERQQMTDRLRSWAHEAAGLAAELANVAEATLDAEKDAQL